MEPITPQPSDESDATDEFDRNIKVKGANPEGPDQQERNLRRARHDLAEETDGMQWDARALARDEMVERQLRGRGIANERVLAAMRAVERHAFVPDGVAEFAYLDTPLPLAEGQTISQPWIVACMLEAAQPRPGDRLLDIGTGSGYAAAVAARLVAQVESVERSAALAHRARQTLGAQAVDNVRVHLGDGTLGWPAGAPYDAIVCGAGGPRVPDAWREQLAIGGCIVMPVGERRDQQRLIKLTRTGARQFEETPLCEVRFVPLIGAQGWQEEGAAVAAQPQAREAPARTPQTLADALAAAMQPLPEPEDASFADAFDYLGSKRVVLLGESTHGTSEFYRARAAITQRLIERHGFNIVAVEADWPDAASIHRYVTHCERRADEAPFQRFPVWMWRNEEFASFVRWLREYNEPRPRARRCAFHGLDIYGLCASIAAVLDYLDRADPDAATRARERYGCLTPWQKDPQVYGRAALGQGFAGCEQAVLAQLQDLLGGRLAEQDGERWFDAAQNAQLVAAAEHYYRAMYRSSAQSWNLRDRHMFATLERLLDFHGEDSRAVVWAHNSHVGHASATEMGRIRDELNIGQLCRERYGSQAALIGFGTHAGTTAAASDWDGPMELKVVRPSSEHSYEHCFHGAGQPRGFLDLAGLAAGAHASLYERLSEPRLERFIGVIYRPETEHRSHYMQATLTEQFDGYVWFDTTRAVDAFATRATQRSPDLYPFGQ